MKFRRDGPKRETLAPVFGACVLALAPIAPPASGVSPTTDDRFDESDSDNDNNLNESQCDQARQNLDADADGVVTRDGFTAGLGGGAAT
jgi:hypothetical protein